MRRRVIDYDELHQQDEDNFRRLEKIYDENLIDNNTEEELLIIEKEHIKDKVCIRKQIGFTYDEFFQLYNIVQVNIQTKTGNRGKKSTFGAADSFYIYLCYLHTNATLSSLAVTYGVSINVIERMVKRIEETIEQPLIKKFINEINKEDQIKMGIELRDFTEVALIIDCSVQPINRPLPSIQKYYYSGKHKIHTLKREYAHAPNGLVCLVSDVFPGSVHDLNVCRSMLEKYKSILKKEHIYSNDEPIYWSILADMGYIGLQSDIRIITPEKGNNLSSEQIARNRAICKNRIIVENFYGRKATLFKVSREKFNRSEVNFKIVDNIMVALTNFHISIYPLRKDQNEEAKRYKLALIDHYKKSEKEVKEKEIKNREYMEKYRNLYRNVF